jgi:hypothetical protein
MEESLRYSRRKLLCNLGLGGLGVAAASWAGPAASFTGTANPLAGVLPGVLTSLHQGGLEDWSGAVGATFLVRDEAGAHMLKLVSVQASQPSGRRPAGLRSAGFTLVFEAAAGDRVPAGNRTYVFEQSNGSQFQLFVGAKVAVGSVAQLVAVLN